MFVHGIYGSGATFLNTATACDWPNRLPQVIKNRSVDVFSLNYRTALMAWARQSSPNFRDVAAAVFLALKPLRQRDYRSIGFVAHSLGGNIVSTYIHSIKSRLGHPNRAQHAFVITLATPVLGSQVADLGVDLKRFLGMRDPLLESLTKGNLYLDMLNEFRAMEVEEEDRLGCRPVHLHAAYEQRYLGPLLVVTPDSAAQAVSRLANSPIVGFALNHSEIAKPSSERHVVYRWVLERIEDEYDRLEVWDRINERVPAERRLCLQGMPLIRE